MSINPYKNRLFAHLDEIASNLKMILIFWPISPWVRFALKQIGLIKDGTFSINSILTKEV